jgi:hypothetical protein
LEAFKDHTVSLLTVYIFIIISSTCLQVLFSYEPLDEIVMTNLQKFAGKPLKSVESSDVRFLLALIIIATTIIIYITTCEGAKQRATSGKAGPRG